MKNLKTLLLLLLSTSVFAQTKDEFKSFIFKDLTQLTPSQHYAKMRDNLIAGFTLSTLSIIGTTQLTDLHGADQNMQAAVKPIAVLAGGVGLLCFYYVGRHSYLYQKSIKPSSKGLGLSYTF